MQMKKLFLIIILTAFGFTVVHAQDDKPKKQVFGWTKKTMDEIGVSTEVQLKIEEFKKQNDGEQKALKESEDYRQASEEEQKKKMGVILGKRHKTIYEMLNKDQQLKVDAMREKIAKENKANGY